MCRPGLCNRRAAVAFVADGRNDGGSRQTVEEIRP
jgi:hypothetical protein